VKQKAHQHSKVAAPVIIGSWPVMTWHMLRGLCALQLMADAAAIDAKAASGRSIGPLCGLPLAVKDSIDVLGYPTTASTPALLSNQLNALLLMCTVT